MNTLTAKTTTDTQRAASASSEERCVAPRVEIRGTQDGYVLEADLPGVSKDGLEILIEGDELTLMGRRGPAPVGELLYREANGLNYRRQFELDPAIDTSKINASVNDGVLRIQLPKAEAVKPRQIQVKG